MPSSHSCKHELKLTLVHSHFLSYFSCGLLKFTSDCLAFFGPLLLHALIVFTSSSSSSTPEVPSSRGWLIASALVCCAAACAFIGTQFGFIVGKIQLRMRVALVQLIYERALGWTTSSLGFGVSERADKYRHTKLRQTDTCAHTNTKTNSVYVTVGERWTRRPIDELLHYCISSYFIRLSSHFPSTDFVFLLPAIHTSATSQLSVGEIVNAMSTDVDRVVNFCNSFHACWSLPFQIAVSLFLLHREIELAFLAGLAFAVLLIPINKVRKASSVTKKSCL